MRFEDQAPTGDDPTAASPADPAGGGDDPTDRKRRRANRPWSSPGPLTPPPPPPAPERERFDKPVSDTAWGWKQAGATAEERGTDAPVGPGAPPSADLAPRRREPEAPRPSRRTAVIPPLDAPDPGAAGPVPTLLGELRAELAQLRSTLIQSRGDGISASLVTGAELAATIEALGTTLGTGMASLLSDHRALLARDIEAAADRILEELGNRLRASGAQVVDAVEERVRHVSAKAMTDLTEQLELRLDQIQAEVTGLRAVMLEIPDQTVVTTQLDQLAETVTATRARESTRVSPALTAAIEKSLAGPIGQIEAGLEALSEEVTALRRRITLRTDGGGDAPERVAAPRPRTSSSARIAAEEAVAAPAAKPAAKKAPPRKATPVKAAAKAAPAKRATKRRS